VSVLNEILDHIERSQWSPADAFPISLLFDCCSTFLNVAAKSMSIPHNLRHPRCGDSIVEWCWNSGFQPQQY